MHMGDNRKRFLTVAAAGAAGYYLVDRVYRYARERWGPPEDRGKSDWVCPGVGAVGAIAGASIAGYAVCSALGSQTKGQSQSVDCPIMSSLAGEKYVDKLDLPAFAMSTT